MVATNFTGGVTNVAEQAATGNLLFPDPSRCHTWFDDFDTFIGGAATTAWLVTTTGGTTLVTDADGGVVAFTNDGTNAHTTFAQWAGGSATGAETFTWESGRSMWLKARFKLSDVTNSSFIMGLAITDTTPLDATDAIVFQKADTSTTLTFKTVKTAAGTTTTNIATLVNDTYVEVAFYYAPAGDGIGSGLPTCIVYLNDVRVAQLTDFTNFPTRTLAITMGAGNGAAGTAVILSTDYLLVSKARAVTWSNP